MTAAKRRELVRAAGTTSGTAEKEQPRSRAQEPGTAQVTPATEERGRGSLPTLWILGARALEKASASGVLPFCSPCSARTSQRCIERCRSSDTSRQTTHAARGEGIARLRWRKQGKWICSRCLSDVSTRAGTAYLSLGHSFTSLGGLTEIKTPPD